VRYIRYLWYVVRHKWFVFLACLRYRLVWRGILHDLSKLRPSEFFPYANFFYGPKKKQVRDETGYYKPTDTGDEAFDFAWLLHQKRNRHHWQWWILPYDDGGFKAFPIPERDLKEMLCDWIGAGRAQGTPDTMAWWKKNHGQMVLEPKTRFRIWQMLEGRIEA
jgi:hypothetical protein